MKRTAEEFKNAAKERGIVNWSMRGCSLCQYPVGFIFHEDKVYWDPGCFCVTPAEKPQLRSWDDVAYYYNLQDHSRVIAEMDAFWGFE